MGAALVELAIALPILLLLLFSVMYVSHLMSARAAITTAVNSVRIAVTRANLPVSNDILSEIRNFKSDGTPSKRLKALLASKELEEFAFAASGPNSYKSLLESQSASSNREPDLTKLENEDLISMVFAINIVRQSLGQHVKTPCKEPGCLLCLPVPAPWADAPSPTITNPPPGAQFAGIQCEYRPDGLFNDVLNSLLKLINPNSGDLSLIVIRRQRSAVFNGWEG